jgi:hypothetical protein
MDEESKFEGIKAAAYIANELEKGTSIDDLVKEFGDERSVSLRIAFISYHNWIAQDIDGRWHLGNKGRFWVKKLLAAYSGISSLPILKSLEEAILGINISSVM